MKKIYTLLSGAAMLLGASAVQAQHYQPILPNHTHHFSDATQDSIFSLIVDSVYTVGTDTVFMLNKYAREISMGGSNPANCSMYGSIRYLLEDGLFGERMLKRTNGDFEFISGNNQVYLLKTNVSVGQSWVFNSDDSIGASITNKAWEPINSSVSDSVYTYTLTNGKTIKLSQNYGLVQMPALKAYFSNNAVDNNWLFYALPEKNIGKNTLNVLSIYDFAVGDSIGWKYENGKGAGSICRERWIRHLILDKYWSTGNDTVFYEIEQQMLTKTYGSPNAPSQFCQNTTATSPIVTDTITQFYTINDPQYVYFESHNFYKQQFNSKVNKGTVFNTTHNKYVTTVQTNGLATDTCAENALIQMLDNGETTTFLEGVGMLRSTSSGVYDYTDNKLEFYRKGTESYGNYTALRILASTKEPIFNSPMAAYPNPFTESFNLELDNLKPGKATIKLYNLLGQQVVAQEVETNQGKQNINLNLQQLPNGVYLVQVKKDAQTESIRIIKQ